MIVKDKLDRAALNLNQTIRILESISHELSLTRCRIGENLTVLLDHIYEDLTNSSLHLKSFQANVVANYENLDFVIEDSDHERC
jgi:hypothetical protein